MQPLKNLIAMGFMVTTSLFGKAYTQKVEPQLPERVWCPQEPFDGCDRRECECVDRDGGGSDHDRHCACHCWHRYRNREEQGYPYGIFHEYENQ